MIATTRETLAAQPPKSTTAHGWAAGLSNLLGQEFASVFRPRAFASQSLLWAGLSVGLAVAVTLSVPQAGQHRWAMAEQIFVVMLAMASGVGAAISGQGAVLDERVSGTAAWILSKPVSRAAFIWAKLIGRAVGFLVTATLLPTLGLAVALAVAGAPVPHLGALLATAGLLALNWSFYLAFATFLGSIFLRRGPVIGLPLGLLFSQSLIAQFAPSVAPYLPGALVSFSPFMAPNGQPLAVLALAGQPLGTALPILSTAVLVIACIALTLWRFERQEL